ncbi:hypothetical protein M441DRAFT_59153 [Trichoderma asperellum CBS 433.97]|uniref:Uncharacterized protein n=1 Tax=Trichoderma asperellum (strain ATCC 204424 / CBS 433.97 / NBRC 101777) TaxID=1042311 RepID=A0A2T3Z6E6_TRIA4|nr:hypothetical protein M441DRAFT_59153 [Trichoderma asperellum CBS 433.97]PTB40401.1 hypothetical protein M441DRAFT_59153 [Trichoderma asperellum CBS 433.97]
MPSSLQCNDQARPLKRKKNGRLADDDETTRQTKQTRRDGHSEAHSSQQEDNLSETQSKEQIEVPQCRPEGPENKPIGSSNTVPSFPLERDTFPQEIWDRIVQYLAEISEIKWSCELHDNLDDPYLDLDGEERRLVTKTLHSLTLTGRILYRSAIEALYRSICLRSAKSAALLFRTLKNDTLFRYNIRDYIRELIILGPLAEYKCCKVLAAQEWPNKASSDSTIHKAIERWESWKGLGLHRKDKDSLEPIVATTMMAELFRMSPQLNTLAIRDAFILRHLAYEYLDVALSRMDREGKKDKDENKAHVFPNLSTFVLLGASDVSQADWTPSTNWTPLIQQHSKCGIKNLRLKHIGQSIKVPSSVRHIQLDYGVHEDLGLSQVKNTLTSLEIYFGAEKRVIHNQPTYLKALPTSLTSLRVHSGYIASYASISFLLKPSMLPHLSSLEVPMALLFENPGVMQRFTGVTDLFPSTILSMKLLEVWLESSHCCDNCDDYGDKMATFLQIVTRDLPQLKSLEFREQWEHWRYALADQKKRLPKVVIAPLFPETSSVLCQRASVYMKESTLTALSLVSKAIALEPRNRKAQILLAQIQANLGRPEEAAKTIASIGSPVHPRVTDPIERMLAHVNTARECWREDPKRAILALNRALKDQREDDKPRELKLIKANAYLLLLPKEERHSSNALNIARELINKKKNDVDALFLAGKASCELRKYGDAVNYFQEANCYDPKRLDIVEWLRDAEVQNGVV